MILYFLFVFFNYFQILSEDILEEATKKATLEEEIRKERLTQKQKNVRLVQQLLVSHYCNWHISFM